MRNKVRNEAGRDGLESSVHEVVVALYVKVAVPFRADPVDPVAQAAVVAGKMAQFVGNDGFSAEMPGALILNGRGSEAWLAIEDPARPWPALPGNHGSAGPFYVVWTRPQATRVNPEQWPYQLATPVSS